MEIRVEREGETTRVRVSGSCDVRCHQELRERLIELEVSGAEHIVVDLSALSFIDSVGLKVLIAAWTRARHGGHQFSVILGGSGQVHRVFTLMGLDRVIPLELLGP
jgi:anti-anti-sigma factor